MPIDLSELRLFPETESWLCRVIGYRKDGLNQFRLSLAEDEDLIF